MATGGIVRMKNQFIAYAILPPETTYASGATVYCWSTCLMLPIHLVHLERDYQYNATSTATPDYFR